VVFAMTQDLVDVRLRDGKDFYCPNGHQQHYSDSSQKQIENLQKRLEWAQNDAKTARDQREATERHARAVRGHATRLRKRIAAGKCPCCAKAFDDLAAHIAEKHPRYAAQDEVGADEG
jgi:hypothetical protein